MNIKHLENMNTNVKNDTTHVIMHEGHLDSRTWLLTLRKGEGHSL